MKIVETEQSCVNGGSPVANEDRTFGHGEPLLIVSKRDLTEFIEKTNAVCLDLLRGVKHIAFSHFKELNEIMIEIELFQKRYPNMFVFNRDGTPRNK